MTPPPGDPPGEVLAVVLAAAAALLGYAAAVLTARYRVVWVRFNLARRVVTRRGARRLARRLARDGETYRLWDAWRGRWVA